MKDVLMYTTTMCPYCARAKSLLHTYNVEPTIIDVTSNDGLRNEMVTRSGRRSVPQIFIGGDHVGGADELQHLHAQGNLDKVLSGEMTLLSAR